MIVYSPIRQDLGCAHLFSAKFNQIFRRNNTNTINVVIILASDTVCTPCYAIDFLQHGTLFVAAFLYIIVLGT